MSLVEEQSMALGPNRPCLSKSPVSRPANEGQGHRARWLWRKRHHPETRWSGWALEESQMALHIQIAWRGVP